MKRIENFRFNDVVLYSKGWYKHSGNSEEDFFNDLERAIRMNEDYWYPSRPFSKDELIGYLLRGLEIIYEHLDEDDKKNGRWYCSHRAFYEEVKHSMRFYDCSEEYAICMLVHAIFQGLTKDEIKLNKPLYKRGRWRLGTYDDKPEYSMTYKYMNSRAAKMFDEDNQ